MSKLSFFALFILLIYFMVEFYKSQSFSLWKQENNYILIMTFSHQEKIIYRFPPCKFFQIISFGHGKIYLSGVGLLQQNYINRLFPINNSTFEVYHMGNFSNLVLRAVICS